MNILLYLTLIIMGSSNEVPLISPKRKCPITTLHTIRLLPKVVSCGVRHITFGVKGTFSAFYVHSLLKCLGVLATLRCRHIDLTTARPTLDKLLIKYIPTYFQLHDGSSLSSSFIISGGRLRSQ